MAQLHWQHDGKAPEPDGEAFEKWMRQSGLAREVDPPEKPDEISKAEADRRKTIAMWRKIEFENKVAAGRYIKRVDSDTVYHRMMGLVRAKLESWVQSMPEMFRDSSREQIAALATSRYDRICLELEAVERVNLLAEPAKREKPPDAKKSKAASKRHRRKT